MKDSSIATIYDMKNGGTPLDCHQIDAKEFLQHPRWSLTPPEDVEPPAEVKDDSGQTMLLKEMTLKALQGMANKAGIDWRTIRKMDKATLITALE